VKMEGDVCGRKKAERRVLLLGKENITKGTGFTPACGEWQILIWLPPG